MGDGEDGLSRGGDFFGRIIRITFVIGVFGTGATVFAFEEKDMRRRGSCRAVKGGERMGI